MTYLEPYNESSWAIALSLLNTMELYKEYKTAVYNVESFGRDELLSLDANKSLDTRIASNKYDINMWQYLISNYHTLSQQAQLRKKNRK